MTNTKSIPRGQVLDLFCGPGGVARGFQRLGYNVVGFDKEEQPRYPGTLHVHDLTDGLPEWVHAQDWDAVWASPPCDFAVGVEAFRKGENLIPLARELTTSVDAPIRIIENVQGAREFLRDPTVLDGGAFGLNVRKRRSFETNFEAQSLTTSGVSYDYCIYDREHPVEEYREAHGFDAECELAAKELRHCIPPAYVEYLHEQAQMNPQSVQGVLSA